MNDSRNSIIIHTYFARQYTRSSVRVAVNFRSYKQVRESLDTMKTTLFEY